MADSGATAVSYVWRSCFQGLASFVRHSDRSEPREPRDELARLPAPEVLAAVLDFLSPSSLATLSIVSSWCRRFADAEEVWRQACVKTWATKQHSARMRSWLAEHCRTPGSSTSSSSDGALEDTWKARYIFALKDRQRCRILPEELCWDSARDEGGRPLPRRWHLKMHLGRWVDKEVIFSPGGGSLSDFDFRVLNFRVFQEIPWRPQPGEGPNEDRVFSDGQEDEDESHESRDSHDGEASRRSVDSDDVEGDGLGTSQASQASQASAPHDEHEEHDVDELQDSDGSADLPQISERSHSSVSSIPVLSTPMMDMEGLSFRTLGSRPLRRRAEIAEAAAAAAGLVDSRRRDLPRPRFLRILRPPPPPLLHFGRRFADGPFLMPLPLPLAAVPLPTPPVVPRRRHASGCSLLEVPSLPFLLRVGRTPDWGWSLTPVVEGRVEAPNTRNGFGHIGRALHFTSRQLSPLEHHCASQTPSATFTLYLKAGQHCNAQGLQGSWECFDGFQGTMRAPTWVGSCITFEFLEEIGPDGQERATLSGSCRMSFAEGTGQAMSLTFRAEPEASQSKEGHMELFVGSLGQGQPCFWQRGHAEHPTPSLPAQIPPLVLVLTMGMFFGSGPTASPTAIPLGLPSLEEASRNVLQNDASFN